MFDFVIFIVIFVILFVFFCLFCLFRYEQARTVSDIIARRLPLLFLDQKLAIGAIDTVSSRQAASAAVRLIMYF